jgi:hypothetical protein
VQTFWPWRIHCAGQLGGEIIHADADQVGALAQRPGVTGVIAEILRHREAANQGGLKTRCSRFMLGWGDLQHRLHGVAGAEMIDE